MGKMIPGPCGASGSEGHPKPAPLNCCRERQLMDTHFMAELKRLGSDFRTKNSAIPREFDKQNRQIVGHMYPPFSLVRSAETR